MGRSWKSTNTIAYSLDGITWIPVENSNDIFSSVGNGVDGMVHYGLQLEELQIILLLIHQMVLIGHLQQIVLTYLVMV